jgi:AcrR family transcriptional regulator
MTDTSAFAAAPAAPAGDIRPRIVEALMALAAERNFEDITISDIAGRAGVRLSEFRDCFPSKGAVLGAFSRKIDKIVLDGGSDALAGEPAKERLFDVLMRRLDALAPYRAGIEGILEWARREPLAAAALNRETVNSLRFMLEAAGIDTEGSVGAVKLQGLAFAWTRILGVWLRDTEPGLSETMAALDRELTRGEKMVTRVEDLHRLTAPLRSLAQALFAARRDFGGRTRERARRDPDEDDVAAA